MFTPNHLLIGINCNVGKLGQNDKPANYIVQFDTISGIVPSNINVSNNVVNVVVENYLNNLNNVI